MKSSSIPIKLKREEGNFHANMAIINGSFHELSSKLHKLHTEELSLYNKLKYVKRQKSYLLGRLSAKNAIMDLTGVRSESSIWIDSGIFQFPVVKCPGAQNIQVSLSHCNDIGLSLAFPETHPMGIDLEKIDYTRKETVLSQHTEKELKLINDADYPDIIGCYGLFSVKESLSKVIRTGMMMDFKLLEIDTIQTKGAIVEYNFSNFGQYKAFGCNNEAYVYSFVLPKRSVIGHSKVCEIFEMVRSCCANTI